jgi:hypothetical protein
MNKAIWSDDCAGVVCACVHVNVITLEKTKDMLIYLGHDEGYEPTQLEFDLQQTPFLKKEDSVSDFQK